MIVGVFFIFLDLFFIVDTIPNFDEFCRKLRHDWLQYSSSIRLS